MVKPECFYIFFDVESVGLYGQGFAVGAVVLDGEGQEIKSRMFACSPSMVCTLDYPNFMDDIKWVRDNVPTLTSTHNTGEEVRTAFWDFYREIVDTCVPVYLVGDCIYPVEALFLIDSVVDKPTRQYKAPYPLLDLASMLFAKGLNPVGDYWQESDGVKHNPLNDARQSARVFREKIL